MSKEKVGCILHTDYFFGLKNRNPASETTMGEPGRHIGIYLIYTHGWTWRAYILYTYTHTHTQRSTWRAYGHVSYTHARVNLESIYLIHTHTRVKVEGIYLIHTHKGGPGGHMGIYLTHTHGWIWRAYILYMHTEYILALKTETLPVGQPWVNLEATALSELSKQKGEHFMGLLICIN